MEPNFLSLLHELEQPIHFTFDEKEEHFFDPPEGDSEEDAPLYRETKWVPFCDAKIDNERYTIEAYKHHVDQLIESSLKSLDKEVIKLKSSSVLLGNLNQRIKDSFNLFRPQSYGLSKVGDDKFYFIGKGMTWEASLKLYQPFYNIQFQALTAFHERFKKKFLSDINLKANVKLSQINFKYSELYNNPKTKRLAKKCFEDLRFNMMDYGVKNKSINAFLNYFGLDKSTSKILLEGDIGDFYTFYNYLSTNVIVSGHDKRTLPNYVMHKTKKINWNKWHSQKHTKKRKHIEDIIVAFIEKLKSIKS